MTGHSRAASGLRFLLVALLSGACGGQASLSPASPSEVAGATAGAAGAVVTGTVKGMTAATTSATFRSASADTLVVTVAGTSLSTTVDGGGRFALSGVPGGTIQLQFKGRGVDGTITIASVASGDRIDITVTLNGGTIRLDGERREGRDGSRTEVEGAISAIDTAARTIRVRDRVIEVPATAVIRRGGRTLTFGDLRAGDRVEVKATVDGTRIIASEIEVEREEDDDEGEDDELEGRIASIDSAARTIRVGDRVVEVPTAAVILRRGVAIGFADLRVGDKVQIDFRMEGTRRIATRIETEGDDEDDDEDDEDEDGGELGGRITAIDAAARTIRVSDRTIEVPATTVIRRGGNTIALGDLRVGNEVEVHFRKEGARIIAARIQVGS